MSHSIQIRGYNGPRIVGLCFVLAACAPMHERACSRGEHSAIHDSLYFGTDKRNGTVTADEWTAFLSDTVTPRFPQGLSVWQASGQWRAADGAIVRESSNVLDLIHPDDAVSEQAVAEIVGIYKSRFQQEAVLRAKAHACVSF